MTTSQTAPNLGLQSGWSVGEDGWGDPMNENLLALDALTHLFVVSATMPVPPSDAGIGDRYIVPVGAVGAWAGQDHAVAVNLGGWWSFLRPKEGWTARVGDRGRAVILFDGQVWGDRRVQDEFPDSDQDERTLQEIRAEMEDLERRLREDAERLIADATARANAAQALAERLDADAQAALAAALQNRDQIAAEVAARAEAWRLLSEQLAAEVGRRAAEYESMATAQRAYADQLAAEVAARAAGFEAMATTQSAYADQLAAEVAARAAGFEAMATTQSAYADQLAAEVAARAAAAAAAAEEMRNLGAALADEVSARAGQFSNLAADILAEALARGDAVRDLAARVSADAAALDARVSADVQLLQNRINLVSEEMSDILGAADYDPDETYAPGSVVRRNGKLFRAITLVPEGAAPPIAAYWALIGDYVSVGDAIAAYAAKLDDHGSRITATESGLQAEIWDRSALAVQLRGDYAGSDLSKVTQGLVYSERQARVSGDQVNASAITGVSSRLTTAEGKVSGHADAITALNTSVTNLDGRQTSQGQALTTVNADLASIRGALETKASSSAVSSLTSRVTTAEEEISSQAEAITRVRADLSDGLATKASASALSALDSRVISAEGRVTSQGQAITALQNDLDLVEGDVATKASADAVTSLTTRVTAAEGVNTSQGTALTSLRNDLTTTQGNVATKASSSAVSALENRVTTAEGEITAQSAATTALRSELEALEDDLGTKASADAVTSLTTRVTAAEGVNTTQGTALTSLRNDLTTTQGDVATKASTTALNALDSKVTAIDGRVTSQASDITSLRADVDGGGSGNLAEPLDTGAYTGNSATKLAATASGVPAGAPGPVIRYTATATAAEYPAATIIPSVRMSANVTRFAAAPGDVFVFSAWVHNAAAAGTVGLRFLGYNAAAAAVGHVTYAATAVRGSWVKIEARHVVAAGTTQAHFAFHLASVTSGGLVYVSDLQIRQIVGFSVAATVQQEALARATADDAQASQITALQSGLATANADISTRATSTAVSALTTRVTAAEGVNTTQGQSLTSLQNELDTVKGDVSTKASAAGLTSLTTRVTAAEGVNTSQGTALTSLRNDLTTTQGDVATKASTSALSALDSKVTAIDGRVTSQASDITSLRADVDGGGSGNLAMAVDSGAHAGYGATVLAADAVGVPAGASGPVLRYRSTGTAAAVAYLTLTPPVRHASAISAITAKKGDVFIFTARIWNASTAGSIAAYFIGRDAAGASVQNAGDGSSSTRGAWVDISARIILTADQTDRVQFYLRWASVPTNGEIFLASAEIRQIVGFSVAATVQQEALARATADDAQASQITALRSDLTTANADIATRATAAALTALTTRVTAAEGVNTTQSTSLTTLQNNLTTGLNTKANTTALTALDSKVTAIDGRVTSQASDITSLRADVDGGGSGNLAEPLDTGAYTGNSATKLAADASGVPAGAPGPVIRYTATATANEYPAVAILSAMRNRGRVYFDVAGGAKVFVSAWVYNANAAGSIRIRSVGYDASNASIPSTLSAAMSERNVWTKIEASFVHGDTATSGAVNINLSGVPSGGLVYVSGIEVRIVTGFPASAAIQKESLARADADGAQATQISTLTGRVGTAEGKVSTLETASGSHASRLTAVETKNGTQDSSITTLQTTTSGQATQISQIKTTADNAQSRVTTLETTTGAHATRLSTLETKSNGAATSITNLQTTTNGHATQLNTLQTSVSGQSTKIQNLETATSDMAESFQTLETNLGTQTGRITTVQNAQAGLTTRVTNVEAKAGTSETKILSLETASSSHGSRLNGIDTEVNGVKTRTSTLETTTSNHAGRLTTVETTANQNRTRVQTLETTTENQAGRLDTIEAGSDNTGRGNLAEPLDTGPYTGNSATKLAADASGVPAGAPGPVIRYTATATTNEYPAIPIIVGARKGNTTLTQAKGGDVFYISAWVYNAAAAGTLAVRLGGYSSASAGVLHGNVGSTAVRGSWVKIEGQRSFEADADVVSLRGYITLSGVTSGAQVYVSGIEIRQMSSWGAAALVTKEEAARIAADDAQASQITALRSDLTTANADIATRATAAALTALTTRVTAAEGVNTTQSTSLTTLQNNLTTGLNTKANTTALNALDSKVTAIDGRVTSQASDITSLRADVDGGGSGNLAEPLDTGAYTGNSATKLAATASGVPAGAPGPVIRYTATATANEYPRIPLVPIGRLGADTSLLGAKTGDVFTISAWVYNAAAAGSIGLRIGGYDAANATKDHIDVQITAVRGSWVKLEGRLAFSSEGIVSARAFVRLASVTSGGLVYLSDVKFSHVVGFQAAAAIQTEALARATADDAQASQITALRSDMTSVQGGLATKADTTAVTSLTTRVTTAEGKITSQASDITTLRSDMNGTGSGNLAEPLDTGAYTGASAAKFAADASGVPAGAPGPVIRYTATSATNDYPAFPVLPYFRVLGGNTSRKAAKGGDVFVISAWVYNAATAGTVGLRFARYNTAGAQVAHVSVASTAVRGSWVYLEGRYAVPEGENIVNGYSVGHLAAVPQGGFVYFSEVSVRQISGWGAASALQAESDARTTADSTQAGQISTLQSAMTAAEGQINLRATTAAVNSLTTRVTTAEGRITSQASDITSLRADVDGGGSGNLAVPLDIGAYAGNSATKLAADASGVPAGAPGPVIRYTATATTSEYPQIQILAAAQALSNSTTRFAAKSGDSFLLSAWVYNAAAAGTVGFRFGGYTAANASVAHANHGMTATRGSWVKVEARVDISAATMVTAVSCISLVSVTSGAFVYVSDVQVRQIVGFQATATIDAERAARVTADNSQASDISTLTARVGTAEGRITSESQARSDGHAALTTQINNVSASANAKGEIIYSASAPPAAKRLAQNMWIDTTSGNNTPKMWNGSAWVAVTEKIAATAFATANDAVSSIATLGGQVAATRNISVAALSGGRYAVAGISVGVQGSQTELQSKVLIQADKFEIVNGTGSAAPFSVSGGVTTMNNAMIKNLGASNISVTNLSAISANIGILRTASTGARTEIRDNLILVYDAANKLRVRIGVW